MAPISAASSSTDNASNGSTHDRNRASPALRAVPVVGSLPASFLMPATTTVTSGRPCQRHNDRDDPLHRSAVEIGRSSDRCASEHQAEEEKDDNRADIDEHLHPGDELR